MKNKKFQVRLDELELNSKRKMESSLSDFSPLTSPGCWKSNSNQNLTKITDELNSLAAKLGQRDLAQGNFELDISEAQLTSVLKDVSLWMEEALLPQLNTVRWLLGAHELRLKNMVLNLSEWLDYIDDLETQLSFTPKDSSRNYHLISKK